MYVGRSIKRGRQHPQHNMHNAKSSLRVYIYSMCVYVCPRKRSVLQMPTLSGGCCCWNSLEKRHKRSLQYSAVTVKKLLISLWVYVSQSRDYIFYLKYAFISHTYTGMPRRIMVNYFWLFSENLHRSVGIGSLQLEVVVEDITAHNILAFLVNKSNYVANYIRK